MYGIHFAAEVAQFEVCPKQLLIFVVVFLVGKRKRNKDSTCFGADVFQVPHVLVED